MNRYIKFLFTLFFYLMMVKSAAQSLSNGPFIDNMPGAFVRTRPDINSIEGTPYLHDDFIVGEVYYGGEFISGQVPLRLNLHLDELEFIEDDVIKVYINPELIDKVVIGDEVFICLSNPQFKTRKKGYVKMWNSGYPSVLTKMRTNCFEYRGTPISEKKPTQFVRDKDVHYLMKSEDDIVLITTVQKLINVLEDHSEELSIFAEEENLSVSNGADVAKLLDYYHQLSAQDL